MGACESTPIVEPTISKDVVAPKMATPPPLNADSKPPLSPTKAKRVGAVAPKREGPTEVQKLQALLEEKSKALEECKAARKLLAEAKTERDRVYKENDLKRKEERYGKLSEDVKAAYRKKRPSVTLGIFR